MMEETTTRLAQRRRELIARCSEQRASLHLQMGHWRQSLSVHDAVYTGLDYVKRHQWWIVGAAVAIVVVKPRRIRNWLQTGTTALSAWRSVAPFVDAARRYLWQRQQPPRLHR
ncbi:MAG TPA: YqjK family protein [Paucimonas sp.]|nr:YqjK family protein [Paucimonas sp.]